MSLLAQCMRTFVEAISSFQVTFASRSLQLLQTLHSRPTGCTQRALLTRQSKPCAQDRKPCILGPQLDTSRGERSQSDAPRLTQQTRDSERERLLKPGPARKLRLGPRRPRTSGPLQAEGASKYRELRARVCGCLLFFA